MLIFSGNFKLPSNQKSNYINFFGNLGTDADVGDGDRGHVVPQIREKCFWGNYYVKFGHFGGKNHVKIGNC